MLDIVAENRKKARAGTRRSKLSVILLSPSMLAMKSSVLLLLMCIGMKWLY
jgi:hypothetical protein